MAGRRSPPELLQLLASGGDADVCAVTGSAALARHGSAAAVLHQLDKRRCCQLPVAGGLMAEPHLSCGPDRGSCPARLAAGRGPSPADAPAAAYC